MKSYEMEPWGSASLRLIESCKMGPRATTGPNWSQIPLSIALGGAKARCPPAKVTGPRWEPRAPF